MFGLGFKLTWWNPPGSRHLYRAIICGRGISHPTAALIQGVCIQCGKCFGQRRLSHTGNGLPAGLHTWVWLLAWKCPSYYYSPAAGENLLPKPGWTVPLIIHHGVTATNRMVNIVQKVQQKFCWLYMAYFSAVPMKICLSLTKVYTDTGSLRMYV